MVGISIIDLVKEREQCKSGRREHCAYISQSARRTWQHNSLWLLPPSLL
ncbi:Hypothetical protein ABZS17I87_00930 [Kosakonia cowanii]